jgi:hypothetical protein
MIRIIFIILLVYLLFKVFIRYVVPLIARYFIRKARQQYQNQDDFINRKDNDPFTKNQNKPRPDLGEYVDFEEIKDEKPNQ